jgi:PAS domain S-box-containing protein
MADTVDAGDAVHAVCPLALDESFLKALINGITEAIYAVDLTTGFIVYWSKSAEAVFGYTADKALGRAAEVLHSEPAYDTALANIKKKLFLRGQWKYRRHDGVIFPAEATAALIQRTSRQSGNSQVVVVVRDLTDRKKLEDRIQWLHGELARRAIESTSELISARNDLAEAQADQLLTAEQFRLLIEGVTDYAILMLDIGGHIMSWNSGASKILGYRENEVSGKHLSLFYADTQSRAGENSFDKALTGGSFDARVRLQRKDGSRFDADLVIAPFFDSAGRLASYSVIVRDVTERVALRRQLQEKERLATIGTTASIFAHEVSNPLNGMSAAIQMFERVLVQQDLADKSASVSIVADLKGEIRRLQSLLEDFRSLARPATLALQAMDLAPLVRDLIKGIGVDLAQTKIVEDFPRTLPPVSGDPDRLKQALLNLIKNAAEAMPHGGTVTIKGYEHGANVCVDVTDTGTGIPEGVKIFDLFHTTKPAGTGLGLAIVKQIVAAHDGSVTYSSRAGEGTTFHIALPAARSAAKSS